MANETQFIKRGNFLIVKNITTNDEYLREPLNRVKFMRTPNDEFVFFNDTPMQNNYDIQQLNVLGRNNIEDISGYTNNSRSSFAWSDSVDQKGSPFFTADEMDEWLCKTLGQGSVNVVVETLPPAPLEWIPTPIVLGAGVPNGVSEFSAQGAGHLFTFDPNNDDEVLFNIDLEFGNIAYGGQALLFKVHWQLFSAPLPQHNVLWELDYAFVSNGEDNYSKLDGTEILDIPVGSRRNREQYTDTFAPISGVVGSQVLQLTLRRNSQGAGQDTYNGDVDLYAVSLYKVI